jgi:DNA-binding HxlR family transcriptional regulator
VKRKSLDGDMCAVARSLDIIGDWWSLLIIRDALSGLRRFGEFQRSLGAAKNILTVRLKALVAEGILETAPASDGSAYQEYLITEKGRALLPVLVALGQWGSEYLFEPEEVRSVPVDAKKRQPLAKLAMRARDGRALSLDDVMVTRAA